LAKLLPVLVLRADGGDQTAEPQADPGALATAADRAAAQMGAENFPVALRLLPRRPRRELADVYRFARFVDDIGDEAPGGPDARLALLDEVERDLRALESGRSALAPVTGLGPLVAAHRVPLQHFLDLVEANRIDQRTHAYETFDDLLGYCRLSAAPVGRIVLHLAAAATPRNLEDSDAVCAALQVLEHCQDVGEDARAGRIYLPAADLRAAGVEAAALRATTTPAALQQVVADQVERSRELLSAGRPLVRRLSGWARFAVAGFVAGGLATADALDAGHHDVLGRDIRPSRLRTAGLGLRLLGPSR
jgi:squalene synthase HpnC